MSTSIIAQRTVAVERGARTRFVPTRAGIINLWDYRDEEFSFADGWLVLRGPNGSGKTKALEVLFPFVLDGRIEPRRLNPFASEDRTMKSNLLYRGQDAAFSYVWLEFAAGTEYVTVGVGLRAQRHSDRVTRWYFVADGRVGVDFSLLDAEDRPVVRKQLANQLGPDAVNDSSEQHRAAVDARLFGLGRERYEQLLNLVLTLRRPQLAKNLDPGGLSQTLTDGLRPLDDDLITEAARSFDDMEAVQRTLDGLVAADDATRSFLGIYSTYLRTHARSAAHTVALRRADTGEHRAEVTAAERATAAARVAVQQTRDATETAEREPVRLSAHLDALKESAEYKSVTQLNALERLVRDFEESARRAEADLVARAGQADKRLAELADAGRRHADHEASVTRVARDLAEEARSAGVSWGEDDAREEAMPARISARVAARRDDIAAVRQATQRLQGAERDRDRAAEALNRAMTEVDQAGSAEQAAAARVQQERQTALAAFADWQVRHDDLLRDLTATRLDFAPAVANAGEHGAIDPRVLFTQATSEALQHIRDERAELRRRKSTVEAESAAVSEERDRIAAERDDAPSSWWARPADRAGRVGAPLWRLVRFVDGLTDDRAGAIEAALEAANVLDAWLHPTDELTASALGAHEQDGYLRPLPTAHRPTGPTLADVLVPEEQDLVDAARIRAVLTSVAFSTGDLSDHTGGTTVSAAGAFSQGIQLGSFVKAAPEYIGATARARRRATRLAECERRLAELADALAELARRETAASATLDAVAAAERNLPTVAAIIDALRTHDRAATLLRAKQEAADAASTAHDVAIADVDAARTRVRRTCAERSLAADAVDDTAAALRRFEVCGDRLVSARREAASAELAVRDAQARLDEAIDQRELATEAAAQARSRYDSEAERVATLRAKIGDDGRAILAEVEQTEIAIEAARRAEKRARQLYVEAERSFAAAQASAEKTREALLTAWSEEQASARLLAPFAQADLLELLRCPAHLRWPAREWPTIDGETPPDPLPADVISLLDAILAGTRDLSPTESSIKQSATRATKALEDLQAQLSGAGQDHRPEWMTDAGIIVVTVADEQGRTPVKQFADRIARDRREQEVLLTESEQRILEDTLLSTLARQIHQRTIDARDLVDAMDREMRTRRMSSGVSIGVGWRQSDTLDEDQKAVCRLLEKNPARLGPGDLTKIRQHFAARIKATRALRGDQTYRELLGSVLDYRRWHVFSFRLHRPGAEPEVLSRARHSQLSGGEQSVSLHLPLFAAAHALFQSARPTSPRLLALDEAFAGVDDNGRSELMGLAVQFDLDLFMTGYDLWATHASVPGCAHYDLSHSPAEHLVSALLLVWDGSESIADLDGSLAAALGSPGTRTRPDAQPAPHDLLMADNPLTSDADAGRDSASRHDARGGDDARAESNARAESGAAEDVDDLATIHPSEPARESHAR
jgi:uncharacterized protein (TIGR02680 family)